MAVDGFKVSSNNVWHAALLVYLYGWESLYQIEDNGERHTEYSFAIASCDAQADIDNYERGQATLADARSFVAAFNQIVQTQKRFRSQGHTQWVSTRWISGEIRLG